MASYSVSMVRNFVEDVEWDGIVLGVDVHKKRSGLSTADHTSKLNTKTRLAFAVPSATKNCVLYTY